MDALQRHDVDRRLLQERERPLVLAPLGPERLLPPVVRLDAVPVTDVHGGLDAEALGRAFECGHAPVLHLVVEDGEGGLIELDDVDAGVLQLACLLVEDRGELPRQLLA